MKKLLLVEWACCVLVALLVGAPVAQAKVVWHDPWLNWDFDNLEDPNVVVQVNDLDIIVDSPTFAPDPNDPSQAWALPFTTISVGLWPGVNNDYDGDGDADTLISYSGAVIPSGASAHGGLYMKGSGLVLDAYWTNNGVQVSASTLAITYEKTRVEGDPNMYMELSIAPGYFESNPGEYAGWENIRTFVNIPADTLGLWDLNDTLDPNSLAGYEVTPRLGGPAGPIITGQVLVSDPNSVDIYLGEIDLMYANENYEALLMADVLGHTESIGVIGQFWNLNPQSPEPTTLVILLAGLGFLARRRRT